MRTRCLSPHYRLIPRISRHSAARDGYTWQIDWLGTVSDNYYYIQRIKPGDYIPPRREPSQTDRPS